MENSFDIPRATQNSGKRRYVGNEGRPRESRWEREWLASYNQQVAWKYENYDPETTEYRPKTKNRDGDECWQCSTPLVGKFKMCCKNSSERCGCYGMPVEPPFCSKECHTAFIEKWKGKD